MIEHPYAEVAGRLGLAESALRELDRAMASITGKREVVEKLAEANAMLAGESAAKLDVRFGDPYDFSRAFRGALISQEQELKRLADACPGANRFEKAVALARSIARPAAGFFLKKQLIGDFLRLFEPKELLRYLGYGSVAELIAKEDMVEVMSVLRFIESNEWMHEFFERAYSAVTPGEFEERLIEIRVLGPRWAKVAEQFVAKKRHNVSHLKEFGVIFLNPITEETSGKFIRDFALLLHYAHEVIFYANLIRAYAGAPRFPERLKSLLRGDVAESANRKAQSANRNIEWLIIQRYLAKENPDDPRLSLPHVNPESLHWRRAERDLVAFGRSHPGTGLELWDNRDWVGALLTDQAGRRVPVSFDLEDNAMSLVAHEEGKEEVFTYHSAEALWLELCSAYAGGEAALEALLVSSFEKGVIHFGT